VLSRYRDVRWFDLFGLSAPPGSPKSSGKTPKKIPVPPPLEPEIQDEEAAAPHTDTDQTGGTQL